jgi:hypothetical protein
MSKQQRDAIDAAMRAEPFDLSQSTAGHRKSFGALMVRPYPADVSAAEVTLGGVGGIELTVAGHAAEPSSGTSASRWPVRAGGTHPAGRRPRAGGRRPGFGPGTEPSYRSSVPVA